MKYVLPNKLNGYLLRLCKQYQRQDRFTLKRLISVSRYFVDEGAEQYQQNKVGHNIRFFVPIEQISEVDSHDQKKLEQGSLRDLGDISSGVEGEYFSAVNFEISDKGDFEYQNSTPLSSQIASKPDSLPIWKPGTLRVFISHRDTYKVQANQLAKTLGPYGISSFVAHDTIEPMDIWQDEILKGLETMELLLAFVTDDFHKSIWANQEVGFALGRGVPVLSVKLEGADPRGFIGREQALKYEVVLVRWTVRGAD